MQEEFLCQMSFHCSINHPKAPNATLAHAQQGQSGAVSLYGAATAFMPTHGLHLQLDELLCSRVN
jgi:hypothetical protein